MGRTWVAASPAEAGRAYCEPFLSASDCHTGVTRESRGTMVRGAARRKVRPEGRTTDDVRRIAQPGGGERRRGTRVEAVRGTPARPRRDRVRDRIGYFKAAKASWALATDSAWVPALCSRSASATNSFAFFTFSLF